MNVLRIYKIRYDRGYVFREIIYPRRIYSSSSRSYPRGQISGFAPRLKARPAKRGSAGPNINRRIFYTIQNLSARGNGLKFRWSDYRHRSNIYRLIFVVRRLYARNTTRFVRTRTIISIEFVSVSRDKRDGTWWTARNTRETTTGTNGRNITFRNRSGRHEKSYPGLISKVNLSRGLIKTEDRNRGPCSRTICPCCPPASIAIVRAGYPRGERSVGLSGVDTFHVISQHRLILCINIVLYFAHRGCSHYIIFCY